jgi:hypothetical protein
LLLAAGLLSLSYPGCPSYEIRSTVHADGGGLRSISFETDRAVLDGAELSVADFRRLLGMEGERGWRVASDSGAEKTAFACEQQVAGAAGWSTLDCGLDIRGSVSNQPFEQVRFLEKVAVEATGDRMSYRATFGWDRLRETLIEHVVARFDQLAAERYPFLDGDQRAELRGLLAGHLAMAMLGDASDGPSLSDDEVTGSFVALAAPILRAGHPAADAGALPGIIEAAGDSRWLEEQLPGFEALVFSEIRIQLTMPGKILETDGEEIGPRTVEWKLSMDQVLAQPVTVHALSEIDA